ncbi:uncharacterized protein LOC144664108 [Oculina patagonica]
MEAIHDKETRLTEPFTIMTINMNGDGYADDRRKLISKITSEVNASVIFCQELPGCFEKEVVKKCGTGVYKFTPTGEEAAVIWRESDFHGDPVRGTDSSIRRIQEKLQSERSDIDVSEVHTRTAMVKLTSRGTSDRTGAPFLAVSWHGIYIETLPNRIKKFNGLILFVRKVCEMKKISSFIIGGDFNLNTLKEVNLTQLRNEGITVSEYVLNNRDVKKSQKVHARGRSFIPHKDNFVFTLAGDIIVSEVKPEELKESEALDHAPVVGILKLKHLPNKKPSKQVIDSRQDLTPENSGRLSTTREAEGGPRRKLIFGNNDHLRETKFSGEPSKELASLPSDGQLLCEVQDDIYTWKFPLDCSQSTIDGRKRSYACSVISISIARAFLTTNIQPPSGEDLSSDWVNLLSQCMQEGNRLYDRTSASLTHRYLPAREAAGLFLVKPIVKVKGPYRLQLVSNRELSTLEKRLQMLTEANQRRATLFIFDNKAIIFLSCSKHSILAIDLHLHTTFGAAIIFAKRFSPDFISRLKEVTGMNDSTCGDFSQVIMYNDAN